MTTRNRSWTIFPLLAMVMALLALPAAAQIPDPLPAPSDAQPDSTKPVKVYILAGQSNMLAMGDVGGDKPGTLETLTRKDMKFPHLIDDDGNWRAGTTFSITTRGSTSRVGIWL